VRRGLHVDSYGWVGSTPRGGVEADVVAVNLYDLPGEMNANAPQWEGKILLVAGVILAALGRSELRNPQAAVSGK
jgi:hypothetical protein